MTINIDDNTKDAIIFVALFITFAWAFPKVVREISVCSVANMKARTEAVKVLSKNKSSELTIIKVLGGCV
jgi:hypothetical protein